MLEGMGWRHGGEAIHCAGEERGNVVLEPNARAQTAVADLVKVGCRRVETVGDGVIGEPLPERLHGSFQKSAARGQLGVSLTVGLDIERQGEIASDHRDRGELVLVPCDLVVRVEHGHAQVTVMLGEVACTRTIEREADEALSRESLSPLDLARHPVEGLAKGIKGEPLDEVSKRVIDKGSTRTEPW